MKQYTWENNKEIKAHEIIYTMTSKLDEWDMNKLIILHRDCNNYVILEGYHCSCYDFDECNWEATEFDGENCLEELKKFLSLTDDCDLRPKAYNYMNWYLSED